MPTSAIYNSVNTSNTTSNVGFFKSLHPLALESGQVLQDYEIAYQTFGQLNEEKSNVIWIVHALTANSNPLEWWPGIVGPGKAIDPAVYFIVCANSLGSPYGSTHPLSINHESGKPYFHDFPLITNRDIAYGFEALATYLDIPQVKLLVGASLGGQQALEWSIINSNRFDSLFLLATNARHSPWGIAFNESQRLAIRADATWRNSTVDAGRQGLKAARSIALLSYRSAIGYNTSQRDEDDTIDSFKVLSYQNYQGEKLILRFNAFSYWVLSKAMDAHNVGRNRGGLQNALAKIKAKTFVLGITTDLLFPISEQQFLADNIANAQFFEVESALGHDGFLTEDHKISLIIAKILSL